MNRRQRSAVNQAPLGAGLSRRGFLQELAGGAAVAGILGEVAAERAAASMRSVGSLAGASTNEDFWAQIRREFLLPDRYAFMNNGSLGPTPKPVYYTVVERYRQLGADPIARNAQRDAAEAVREKAAAFVGADVDEIALTRNTTEGMSLVANGLDLKAGDEILHTFHEHNGGLQPWKLKAKRHGVVLTELKFPIPTPEPADILKIFSDAITPQTKVISICHVTYQTGTMMPVKELAALARSRGILILVDAAHPLGMMALDLHDLGIDYYAMSPHKWLDAPMGTGLLYMRRESQDRVWPTIVTSGWDDAETGAMRFDRFSYRAWPLVLATGAAIDFQNAIGRERIEARVRQHTAAVRRHLETIDGVRVHTSAHPDLHCGLTAFTYEGYRNVDVMETLLRRNSVRVRTIDWDLNAVRVSTHHYNTPDEVERLAEGLREIPSRGIIPAPAAAGDDD